MQIIQTLCDVCHAQGEQSESKPVIISVDGNATEVDLCITHRAIVEDALEPFYELGRRPEGKAIRPVATATPKKKYAKDGPASFLCNVEGCGRAFPSSQGLAMHRVRVHELPGNIDLDIDPNTDIDRIIEGETGEQRKRRREREKYSIRKAAEMRGETASV